MCSYPGGRAAIRPRNLHANDETSKFLLSLASLRCGAGSEIPNSLSGAKGDFGRSPGSCFGTGFHCIRKHCCPKIPRLKTPQAHPLALPAIRQRVSRRPATRPSDLRVSNGGPLRDHQTETSASRPPARIDDHDRQSKHSRRPPLEKVQFR